MCKWKHKVPRCTVCFLQTDKCMNEFQHCCPLMLFTCLSGCICVSSTGVSGHFSTVTNSIEVPVWKVLQRQLKIFGLDGAQTTLHLWWLQWSPQLSSIIQTQWRTALYQRILPDLQWSPLWPIIMVESYSVSKMATLE